MLIWVVEPNAEMQMFIPVWDAVKTEKTKQNEKTHISTANQTRKSIVAKKEN